MIRNTYDMCIIHVKLLHIYDVRKYGVIRSIYVRIIIYKYIYNMCVSVCMYTYEDYISYIYKHKSFYTLE